MGPALRLSDEEVPEHLKPCDRARFLGIDEVGVKRRHRNIAEHLLHVWVVAHGIIWRHAHSGSCLNATPQRKAVIHHQPAGTWILRIAAPGRQMVEVTDEGGLITTQAENAVLIKILHPPRLPDAPHTGAARARG